MKKLLLGLFTLGAINLSAADKIKIGADPTIPPFTYDKASQIVGADIDIIDAIFKELDLSYEIIPSSYNDLCDELNKGTFDLAISFLGNDKYTQGCDHTASYYETNNLYLKLEDDPTTTKEEMKGKKVGYDIDIDANKEILEKIGATPVGYNSYLRLFSDLQYKKIDFIFLNSAVSMPIIKENYTAFNEIDRKSFKMMKDFNISKKIQPFIVEQAQNADVFYMVGKGKNADLVQKINKVINDMRQNGEMEKILKKYDLE
ncbi:MAG: substrate-binding periplasmic protein [Campylobacter sp.]